MYILKSKLSKNNIVYKTDLSVLYYLYDSKMSNTQYYL